MSIKSPIYAKSLSNSDIYKFINDTTGILLISKHWYNENLVGSTITGLINLNDKTNWVQLDPLTGYAYELQYQKSRSTNEQYTI